MTAGEERCFRLQKTELSVKYFGEGGSRLFDNGEILCNNATRIYSETWFEKI